MLSYFKMFFSERDTLSLRDTFLMGCIIFSGFWIGVVAPFFTWVWPKETLFSAHLTAVQIWFIYSILGFFALLLFAVTVMVVIRSFIGKGSVVITSMKEKAFSALEPNNQKLNQTEQLVHYDGSIMAKLEEKVVQTSDETNLLSNQITTYTEKVEQSSSEFYKILHNIFSISTSMERILETTAETETVIHHKIKNVAHSSMNASQVLQSNIEFVNELENMLGSEKSDSQMLDKQIETHMINIEKVVTGIMDISRKTRVLALNASIEAVRIGEQGKSFLVVAKEVQDVAKITADLTEKISYETNEMSKIYQKVVNHFQQAKQLKETVPQVQLLLDQVTATVHDTERSIQKQNETIKEMSLQAVLEEIDRLGEVVTRNNRDLAIMPRELSETIENIHMMLYEVHEYIDEKSKIDS